MLPFSDSKSITVIQEYSKGTVSSEQEQEERQRQLERFWSRFHIKPISQGFVDFINKTKEDEQSDKKIEVPQLTTSLLSQTEYHDTVEEICQVKNQMEEQGIPQGSMQAVDSATQALQEVNNLHTELNSQLPAEMKKIYDAQGKMEGQVNTLTSSLQSIMAQLQQISNHQDKVVQAISDNSRTVGKSSHDKNPSDINAESSYDSLDENSSNDNDRKDSHHHSHGQFRFKVPDEKYNGNSYKIESWLFNLEEYCRMDGKYV
ncbi:hypothetical protein INT45_002748 [Circinella minor]|uniref:Uncharacterized protein n=1 Tax=Circinella minor TaxID=1195481 RepID=A0A8H7S2Z5_9FUNG|nr:hypothetical protein INT45_002748 [Circinella minor]